MRKRFEHLKDMYCPNCGTKDSLWEDTESGDYCQGCNTYCVNCKYSGYGLYFDEIWSHDYENFNDLLKEIK